MATKTAAKKPPAKKAPAKTTSLKQVLDSKDAPKTPSLYIVMVKHTDPNAMVEHTAKLSISAAKYNKLITEGRAHGVGVIKLPGVPGDFLDIRTKQSTDAKNEVRYQWTKLINASGEPYTNTTWIKRRMAELLEYGFSVHSAVI
jgi:hypothetical protein